MEIKARELRGENKREYWNRNITVINPKYGTGTVSGKYLGIKLALLGEGKPAPQDAYFDGSHGIFYGFEDESIRLGWHPDDRIVLD